MKQPGFRSPVVGPWLRRFFAAVALVGLCTCNITIHPTVDGTGVVPMATVVDEVLGNLAFGGLDQIDLTEQFQNQGVTKAEVSSVALSSMTIAVQSPQGATFDFLQSVSFLASADGLPQVEVAHLDMVPKGSTSLDMTIDPSVELAPYVVAPSMSLIAHVTGSKPSQDTTLGVHVALDVAANLPGCGH